MCSYKYQKKKHPLENQPCIYPDLCQKYPNQLIKSELPIDSEGLCLFHSRNISWKNQNGFTERFAELIVGIEEVNTTIDDAKSKLSNNFSGFQLCGETKPVESIKYVFEKDLDFSYGEFLTAFTFLDSKVSNFDIDHCHFHDTFTLKNVYFYNNLDCLKGSFDNGINILNCELTAYTFFDSCRFKRVDKYESALNLKHCPTVGYLTFIESHFEKRASFEDTVFNAEVIYDQCVFDDEFFFHRNQVNGEVSFKEVEFLLSANQNPMYSTVDFNGVKLNKNGKLVFIGKKPLADVVKGEMQMGFEGEGHIVFDNFNLNKIFPKQKEKLLALEKTGQVEIGKGCRKYYCQTDVITLEGSHSNQKLILDITTVFCNYFEIQQGYNLGIEIVERNKSYIKYFYFTDEELSKEELDERIIQNENSLWETFSNLTLKASLVVSKRDMETKNCLIDIASLFLKIGNQIEHNSLPPHEFENLFQALIPNGESSVDTQGLLKEITFNWQRFNKSIPNIVVKSITMGDTYINNGTVEQFGKNNYKAVITGNSNISSEDKDLIFKIIEEIKKESEPGKKENKLIKFIKDFGPTIGETAVKMISAFVKH